MPKDKLQNTNIISSKQKWNNLIDKFGRALLPEKHELGGARDSIVDSVRVGLSKPRYLQEIAYQNIEIDGLKKSVRMLHMDKQQLRQHQIFYDKKTKCLKNIKGEISTTVGKNSKGENNVQAFVLSKKGELYIGNHGSVWKEEAENLSHASFLDGVPVEMAGLISINNDGKIDYISDDSGHYAPDELDMYRCIKKMQKLMPDIFMHNCNIVLDDGYERENYNILQFVQHMERKDEKNNTPYYQQLRNKRIQRIEQDTIDLKKATTIFIDSKGDILEDIASLGIKETLDLEKGLSKKFISIVAKDTKENKLTQYSMYQIITSALDSGNILAMKKLLDLGISKRSEYMESFPLHRTIWRESIPMVKLLIQKGEDINRADDDGTTPLMVAAAKGNIDIIQELLNYGADFNTADKDGNTPLTLSIKSGNVDAVKKFINLGIDINVQDNNGNTPIIIAIKETVFHHNTKNRIVKMLLENNANAYIKNKEGDDSSSILLRQGDLDILKMVLTHKNNLQVEGPLRNKTSHVADYLTKKKVTKRLLQK